MKWCILWELDVISHAFSNVGMQHDAIQQPTTFSHQKPTTKPSRLFHRFHDTFPDSTKKEKHKLKETPSPPFLKIASGFRVTHIKKTHLDVLKKTSFSLIVIEDPGKRPHSLSASGVPPPRTLTEWYLSARTVDENGSKTKAKLTACQNLGGFSEKRTTNFWEIYISSQVAIVIPKAQVHQNSSLPASCIQYLEVTQICSTTVQQIKTMTWRSGTCYPPEKKKVGSQKATALKRIWSYGTVLFREEIRRSPADR